MATTVQRVLLAARAVAAARVRADTLVMGPHLYAALAALEAGEDPLRCELIARQRLVPREMLARDGRAGRDVRAQLIAAGKLRPGP
jgi:hypothetical protein